ncbi:MAG: cyclic nucleotide-binding domain-containing protein [Cyanobacteria bacterium J06621_8]
MIGRFGRLPQLLLLGVTVLTYNVVGMAIANSLFVSHVGAGELPLAFILIGLCSFPAYGLFSQIADRYSRPQIFRYVLLGSILLMLSLRLLLNLDAVWVYYALLIVIFFQWDFNNNLLYPGLLTDYFTTLEYKDAAPAIGIAQAVGALIGGAITILLSHYFPSRELLWGLPCLMAIALGQLMYLERSQRRLQPAPKESKMSLIASAQALLDVSRRYPLILFLAASTFLLVTIYLSSEFLWFNIYGQQFGESELTGFLGLMRIVLSLIQVMFLYGVTRPLLKWVGVARLNAVYPITTLFSLGGLLFNFNLPAAIALHVNGDALYKAINLPIHQLNYNGIPHQYIGRVRALSDGLIYSLGLTLAGFVLWICHLYLSLGQITCLAISLTLILLLIRLPTGRFYLQGLEEMIRSDAIDLDDFMVRRGQLPSQFSTVVQEFLQESDHYTQIKGLELAYNLGNPEQFLPDIRALLLTIDAVDSATTGELLPSILKLYSCCEAKALPHFVSWLNESQPLIKSTALEILVANQYAFEDSQLAPLVTSDHQQLQALALVATFQDAQTDKFRQLEPSSIQAIARVVAHSQNPELITLIEGLLPQVHGDTKAEVLNALVNLATPGDIHVAQIAVAEMDDDLAAVRTAAFKILEITHCPETLPDLVTGLADPSPQVQKQVACCFVAYGQAGLQLAQEQLGTDDSRSIRTAIAAIGQFKSRSANEILFKHLAPEFQQLAQTRRWQQQIPQEDASWQLLAVAIADYQQRLLQKVLYVLSCLGYARTVNLVQRILATSDRRDLANAVEVLSSINHRRFIQPLMPLLEQTVSSPSKVPNPVEPSPQWFRNKGYRILLEALDSSDRWIKTGASMALAVVPTALLKDPDPVVKLVAQEIFPSAAQFTCPVSTAMNRLLLLRNVPLFKNLSLDELFSIDQALSQRQLLPGEIVYTEGSWGGHLYIIASGRIQIVKELDGKPEKIKQLTRGQYFGEIALFDEAPRWDGAIALEESVLLCLEKKRFLSLISQRPQIVLEICRFLSQRLRETDKYLSSEKMRSMK